MKITGVNSFTPTSFTNASKPSAKEQKTNTEYKGNSKLSETVSKALRNYVLAAMLLGGGCAMNTACTQETDSYTDVPSYSQYDKDVDSINKEYAQELMNQNKDLFGLERALDECVYPENKQFRNYVVYDSQALNDIDDDNRLTAYIATKLQTNAINADDKLIDMTAGKPESYETIFNGESTAQSYVNLLGPKPTKRVEDPEYRKNIAAICNDSSLSQSEKLGQLVNYRTEYCKERAVDNTLAFLLHDDNKLSDADKEKVYDISQSNTSLDEKIAGLLEITSKYAEKE